MTKKTKNSNMLQEAIVDANTLKEMAIENAKEYLAETFSPRIQNILRTKLQNEEDKPDDDETLLDPNVPANDNAADVANAQPEAVPTELPDEIEDEKEKEGAIASEEVNPEDDVDGVQTNLNNDEDEDDKEIDIESVLRELEDDEPEEEVPVEPEQGPEGAPETAPAMDSVPAEDDDEDLDIELEDDEKDLEPKNPDEVAPEELPVAPDETPVLVPDEEDEKLKEENVRLTTELNEYKKAFITLRNNMNEVNLLNAKLLYSQKITKSPTVTESQKNIVINAMDRANSIREVKLTFANLVESFGLNKAKTRKKSINEGASGAQRGLSKSILNEAVSSIERIQKLSGIRVKAKTK